METIRANFFEDPLYVYIALAFVELVLVAIWYERRRRAWAMWLLSPALAGGLVLAVSTLVVTDREQILAAAGRIVRDLEAGSVAAAGEYLDEGYRGLGGDKQGALAAGRAAIQAYRIQSIRFTRMNVEVASRQGRMHAATIIELVSREWGSGGAALAWDVRWVKRKDGWRIIDVGEPQHRTEF